MPARRASQTYRTRKSRRSNLNPNPKTGLRHPSVAIRASRIKDNLLMAQKPSGARAYKHPTKARERVLGKPMRQQIAKQTRAKSRPLETPVKDVSGDRKRNGGTVERVRIVCAADCKPCPDCGEPFCVVCQQHYADCTCLGPSNAEEPGFEIVEEMGQLWGIRSKNKP